MSSRRHKTSSKDKESNVSGMAQFQSSPPQTELKFFMFSDPAEARSPSNKKLVRSHVARTSHAKSRRARSDSIMAGSSSQGAIENTQYDYEAVAPENSKMGPTSSTSWGSSPSYEGVFNTSGPSFVSAVYQTSGKGPANYVPGQLSPDEQYLLDHCRLCFLSPPHSEICKFIHGYH